jgi:hypothetical protein
LALVPATMVSFMTLILEGRFWFDLPTPALNTGCR